MAKFVEYEKYAQSNTEELNTDEMSSECKEVLRHLHMFPVRKVTAGYITRICRISHKQSIAIFEELKRYNVVEGNPEDGYFVDYNTYEEEKKESMKRYKESMEKEEEEFGVHSMVVDAILLVQVIYAVVSVLDVFEYELEGMNIIIFLGVLMFILNIRMISKINRDTKVGLRKSFKLMIGTFLLFSPLLSVVALFAMAGNIFAIIAIIGVVSATPIGKIMGKNGGK